MKKIKVVLMSSNFVRSQEILNQATPENFTCQTRKLANLLKKYISSFPNRDPLLKSRCFWSILTKSFALLILSGLYFIYMYL